jgi:hypothetical protein
MTRSTGRQEKIARSRPINLPFTVMTSDLRDGRDTLPAKMNRNKTENREFTAESPGKRQPRMTCISNENR